MANVKPFYCIRPNKEVAKRVAALPYDVFSRVEAKEEAKKDSLSFLNIDRPETQFEDTMDMYDDRVYKKAKELLEERRNDGTYIKENKECYYIYELIMNGRSQTGIVACASIDDYQNNVIMKHENTREEKEIDRIRHVDTCNAQTGPIFLAYRSNEELHNIVAKVKTDDALYAFTKEDGVTHNVWLVDDDSMIQRIKEIFHGIHHIYIADGHHRAASAVKVGLSRREKQGTYTGEEEFNYFLSVLFPEDELMILPYNRVVRDLHGHTNEEFLELISKNFMIHCVGIEAYEPKKKGSFGMYLDGKWYELIAHDNLLSEDDPVKQLDVSILQDYLLNPILGIKDPRIDERIDFIGGIRGLGELEHRVKTDMKVAFSMYPTSIRELFAVSDANQLMPPKSTWFEPKLRSGIFIHSLDSE